ncbi:MAG: hypothetical protein GXP54_05160 [Deltaproteobacteria bacterium]|nr:hypothetical protein [Deltaproteobacteria bacterium]
MSDAAKYDVRILDRMIETGRVTKKDLDDVLKNLPDVTDKAENVEASLADRDDAAAPAPKAAPSAASTPKAKTSGKKKSGKDTK